MTDKTNEITISEEELGALTCATVAAGVVVGVLGTAAALGYAAYKTYQALADSDAKITLTIEDGAAGQKALPTPAEKA